MHIYCSFHKYKVHKFKLSQPFFVLLALMYGSAHRAGGNVTEGSIKYNERNRNVYLGKVCAQMYTMKTRGNEPTFSINERKCAATNFKHARLEVSNCDNYFYYVCLIGENEMIV